jgi:hypothetical protein
MTNNDPVLDATARALEKARWLSMMALMTVQSFREMLVQRPFQPFRPVMSRGQSDEVRHPEMAFLTRSDILVGIDDRQDGIPAEFKLCSLLHVSAIEPLSPAASGPR